MDDIHLIDCDRRPVHDGTLEIRCPAYLEQELAWAASMGLDADLELALRHLKGMGPRVLLFADGYYDHAFLWNAFASLDSAKPYLVGGLVYHSSDMRYGLHS